MLMVVQLVRAAVGANVPKEIYVLVGPPSIGKSTWVDKTFGSRDNVYAISRDDIANIVAKKYNMKYEDLFFLPDKSPINSEIQMLFNQRVSLASASSKPIVIDMTNMTIKSRRRALIAIQGKQKEYKKVAVVFKFEGAAELIKKVAIKRSESSKKVPAWLIDQKIKEFNAVSLEEGFDEIIHVDNLNNLELYLDSDTNYKF